MSFISSIKKIGRAVDPTSKKSALGALTRTALAGTGQAFGIPAPLTAGALASIGKGGSSPKAPAGSGVKVDASGNVKIDVPSPSQPFATPTIGNTLQRTNPAMLAGLVAAAALAVYLIARK